MASKVALSARDMNSQKIVNLGAPASANDAARKTDVDTAQSAAQAYTDAQLASVASGQTLKGSVRAAATTNVTISGPGATIDGVTASNGDIFLLTGQTTGSENGPYVYNGSASAMTRATNWDTSGEAVVGSYWIVREGSNADKFALLTNDTFTLGTTTGTFAFIGASTGGTAYSPFAANIPTISAGGTGTVTHNLNSRDVGVAVVRATSPYDEVDVSVRRTTVNTVDIMPDVAVTSGDFRVLVWKVG